MLAESHEKVLALADKYSNEELFTKKYFSWTGTTDLGSYFVSTTSSHYDWAIKKIKLHCIKTRLYARNLLKLAELRYIPIIFYSRKIIRIIVYL